MNVPLIEFLAKAFVPFAVLLAFALARRYMSANKMKAPAREYSREELDLRFRHAKWIVVASMILIGGLLTWGLHVALLWSNRHLAAPDTPAEFWIWPPNAIWWFFPGFAALTLAWEATFQIWSRFGNRDEANLYAFWSSQKAGFDTQKMLRWLAILITLPVGILTTLALPMHTALRQNDIKDCEYAFALCKIYRYADARRITVIEGFRDRDGKLTPRAGIVIDFSDGRRWSSADGGDFTKFVDPDFATFLAAKTHLSFSYAQSEADIPALPRESGAAKP